MRLKTSFSMGAIALTCFGLLLFITESCNDEHDEIYTSSNDDTYTALCEELETFDSIYANEHPTVGSRNIFKKIKNFFNADFEGIKSLKLDSKIEPLGIGVTIVGCISNSIEGWKKGYQITTNERQELIDFVRQNEEALLDMGLIATNDSTCLGYLHNRILIDYLKRGNLNSNRQLTIIQLAQIARRYGISLNKEEINYTIRKVSEFIDKIYDESIDVTYQRLIAKYPESKNSIMVLSTYLKRINQLDTMEEIKAYTADYIAIIDSSEISVDEKQELIENITVGPASKGAWGLLYGNND